MHVIRRDLVRLHRMLRDELAALESCRVLLDHLPGESDERDEIERAFETHVLRAQILQRAITERHSVSAERLAS